MKVADDQRDRDEVNDQDVRKYHPRIARQPAYFRRRCWTGTKSLPAPCARPTMPGTIEQSIRHPRLLERTAWLRTANFSLTLRLQHKKTAIVWQGMIVRVEASPGIRTRRRMLAPRRSAVHGGP